MYGFGENKYVSFMELLPSTFWELAGAVLVVVLSGVAVKVGLTFDINRWIELRRERLRNKLQVVCPHTTFIKEGDRYGFESCFLSPSGTLMYQCRMCGLVTPDIRGWEHMAAKYLEDQQQYFKKRKAYERCVKKLHGKLS